MRSTAGKNRSIQIDSADRVLVNIHLDGEADAQTVAQEIKRAGEEILAIDREWRAGVISARVPISALEIAALSSTVA